MNSSSANICLLLSTPSLFICASALLVLLMLLVAIAAGALRIDATAYRLFRHGAVAFATIFAVISAWRLMTEVAIPRSIENDFVPELVGYLGFWILVPPTWFFVEYYAVDSGAITGLPNGPDGLKRTKDYSDIASKIWAAVVAIMILLISLKK